MMEILSNFFSQKFFFKFFESVSEKGIFKNILEFPVYLINIIIHDYLNTKRESCIYRTVI